MSFMDQTEKQCSNAITVKDYMHQWIELYVKGQLSPTTVQHYAYQTEKYILPVFGDLYLQQLHSADIQKWVLSLQNGSPLTGKPLAPKTIKNIVMSLSAAMKKAVMLELIPENPCNNLTLPKQQRTEPDVYSMEEVEQLLNCAYNTTLYLPLMIEVCLGLRRGELLALRWRHVDFSKGILSVEEYMITVKNQQITKTLKSKSGRRSIQIPATLLEYLEYTYLERSAEADDYIVCQPDGTPYKSDSFSLKFRRFLKANGLRHLRLQDLRHINATIMLTSGISPKIAQERLGHASEQVTQAMYRNVLQTVEKETANKIEAILFDDTIYSA